MKIMKQKQNLGSLLIFLSALMFGSYGMWSRLIGSAMGNFFQGWTRAACILLLLIPLLFWRREIAVIKKKDWGWLSLFLLFTSLTLAPLFYAFNNMDIASASLLFFVSMFLTMNAIGFLFFNEKITIIKIIASFLALIGMYLVFSFSLDNFTLLAAVMAVVAGVASGGEVGFSKKLTGQYSPLYVVALSWFIILISNFILSLALGETQLALAFSMPWLWQLLYSLASLLGFWLVIAGFKYIDASIGSLIGLLEIIFSIILGLVVFKENLTFSIIIGGILIITAAALPHILQRKYS